MSYRFSAFEVTLSGLAGGEYLPLPASEGLAFPFLLTLDGYPTSPAIYAQGQGFSPKIKETPDFFFLTHNPISPYTSPIKKRFLIIHLKNFTDASCLDFGTEQNLFLEKVGRAMPWFVNAYSKFPVADSYRQKVEEITAMDVKTWRQKADCILEEDNEISANFIRQGLSHYAIKYNRFIGVISDYFTTEDSIEKKAPILNH